MREYINQCYNDDVGSILMEMVKTQTYDCNDPRLRPRARKSVETQIETAQKTLDSELRAVSKTLDEMLHQMSRIPFCTVLTRLATTYFGATEVVERDAEYPMNSSKTLSVAF